MHDRENKEFVILYDLKFSEFEIMISKITKDLTRVDDIMELKHSY